MGDGGEYRNNFCGNIFDMVRGYGAKILALLGILGIASGLFYFLFSLDATRMRNMYFILILFLCTASLVSLFGLSKRKSVFKRISFALLIAFIVAIFSFLWKLPLKHINVFPILSCIAFVSTFFVEIEGFKNFFQKAFPISAPFGLLGMLIFWLLNSEIMIHQKWFGFFVILIFDLGMFGILSGIFCFIFLPVFLCFRYLDSC